MLAAIDAGEADVILAYSNSRLTRRPLEWYGLIERANAGKLQIHTVVSGSHDLTTADGRAVAYTIAAWDGAEAERTSERARRAKAQAASAGLWQGGRRPFGYEKNGMIIRESEAVLIRQATRDILAGRSFRTIAKEWGEAGALGTSGGSQDATRIRRILLRPRNAGLLESRGQIIGPGAWPAIVSEDEWRALVATVTNPARRSSPGPERRWLGSGLYRCGECQGTMYISGSRGRSFYTCSVGKHVMRYQPPVDEYVVAVLHKYLNNPLIIDRLRPADNAAAFTADRERAQVLRQRLLVAEADYYAGDINAKQLHGATERLEGELQTIARREANRLSGAAFADLLSGPDPAAAFDAATLDRRRAILGLLLDVTISRGRRGRPKGWKPGEPYADLDSVEIRWRPAGT